MIELLDRRVLGAIEFVDAVTAARMRGPLRIEPEDARVRIEANRSYIYVIHGAPGLEQHVGEFARMPARPAAESLDVAVTVTDPARRYLPRMARIKLPRKDAPASDPLSVLNPIVVPMYPATSASVGNHWAVLRVRVQAEDGTARGLRNALIVVSPQLDGISPVTALTGPHGEALAAFTGIAPILPSSGGDAVLTREFACHVEVVLDRRVVRIESQTSTNADVLPDPQAIAADRTSGHPDIVVRPQPLVSLSAGKSVSLTLEVAWP